MDDLISRDDVYNVLKKVNIREMPIYVFDKLWNGIRDLPSIEPKERTVKVASVYKPIEGTDNVIHVTCCEKCERVVSIFDDYCPGCGAKLEWEDVFPKMEI